MERRIEQPTIVDAAALELGGPRTVAFLDQCERPISCEKLVGGIPIGTPGLSDMAILRAATQCAQAAIQAAQAACGANEACE